MDNRPQNVPPGGNSGDDTASAMRGLIVPGYFLCLLAFATWVLIPDSGAPDGARILLAFLVVGSVLAAVVLFVFQWRRGIVTDKRNWMDIAGFAGFPWRKKIAEDWDETDRRNPR